MRPEREEAGEDGASTAGTCCARHAALWVTFFWPIASRAPPSQTPKATPVSRRPRYGLSEQQLAEVEAEVQGLVQQMKQDAPAWSQHPLLGL